jgi:phosphatidylserine/phosphatidylglycerophosphate/cardiolipin synthase-like enzyme
LALAPTGWRPTKVSLPHSAAGPLLFCSPTGPAGFSRSPGIPTFDIQTFVKYILLALFLAGSLHAAEIQVFFSPKGGCTPAVVTNLNQAKVSVLVQAYSFTSAPIAKALESAHNRGVKVEVILDKSQRTEKYSEADFLSHAGIPVFIDAKHAIAHNKVMVIDGRTVLTGSFNFTKAAEENNAENLLVISDAALAAKYSTNWQAHYQHSEAYQRK